MKTLIITLSLLLFTIVAFQPNADAKLRGVAKKLPPYRGLTSESHHKHKKNKHEVAKTKKSKKSQLAKNKKSKKHEVATKKSKKKHHVAKNEKSNTKSRKVASKESKKKKNVAKAKHHKHKNHDSEYVLHPVFE